ncbi:hypothetical protein GC177_07945 [bacterium]|nr:hypothetical protein [bacterium]
MEAALAALSRAIEAKMAQARQQSELSKVQADGDTSRYIEALLRQIGDKDRELAALRHDLKASDEVIVREKAKAQSIQDELNRVHDEHAAITGTYEAELSRLRQTLSASAPENGERLSPAIRAELSKRLDKAIATVEKLLETH